mmetsp:Transcript_14009/g.23159  ORF Transcript_14009/g.23159 Transcript_14009/m.23159 type:complete len:568 (+) Transcript_14009:121-1824(+)
MANPAFVLHSCIQSKKQEAPYLVGLSLQLIRDHECHPASVVRERTRNGRIFEASPSVHLMLTESGPSGRVRALKILQTDRKKDGSQTTKIRTSAKNRPSSPFTGGTSSDIGAGGPPGKGSDGNNRKRRDRGNDDANGWASFWDKDKRQFRETLFGTLSVGVFTLSSAGNALYRSLPIRVPSKGRLRSRSDLSSLFALTKTAAAAVASYLLYPTALSSLRTALPAMGIVETELITSLGLLSNLLSAIFAVRLGMGMYANLQASKQLHQSTTEEVSVLRRMLSLAQALSDTSRKSMVDKFVGDYSACVLSKEVKPNIDLSNSCGEALLKGKQGLERAGLFYGHYDSAGWKEILDSFREIDKHHAVRISTFGTGATPVLHPWHSRLIGLLLIVSCIPRMDRVVFTVTSGVFSLLDASIDGASTRNWMYVGEKFTDLREDLKGDESEVKPATAATAPTTLTPTTATTSTTSLAPTPVTPTTPTPQRSQPTAAPITSKPAAQSTRSTTTTTAPASSPSQSQSKSYSRQYNGYSKRVAAVRYPYSRSSKYVWRGKHKSYGRSGATEAAHAATL